MSDIEREAFEQWKRDVVLHGKSDMTEIDWHMAWLGWKGAVGFGNQLGSSYVSRLIDAISPPKSGEAIEHDITEYTITGSVKWLAQQARKELRDARAQAPASGEVEPVGFTWDGGRFGHQFTSEKSIADRVALDGVAVSPVYTHPLASQVPESYAKEKLTEALRQFRHNSDNTGSIDTPEHGFVFGYDKAVVDDLVALLTTPGNVDTGEARVRCSERLPELNDEVRWILGRPNFACAPMADYLRSQGHEIQHKAEDEQAAVIHWMLTMYAEHGADWKRKASDLLSSPTPPTAQGGE